MRSGRLRERITIRKPTLTQSGTGGTVSGWATLATVWASVEDLTGRERIQADAGAAEATVRVRMRYVAGLDSKSRIIVGRRTLEIVHVNNVGNRNEEYELLCREDV